MSPEPGKTRIGDKHTRRRVVENTTHAVVHQHEVARMKHARKDGSRPFRFVEFRDSAGDDEEASVVRARRTDAQSCVAPFDAAALDDENAEHPVSVAVDALWGRLARCPRLRERAYGVDMHRRLGRQLRGRFERVDHGEERLR